MHAPVELYLAQQRQQELLQEAARQRRATAIRQPRPRWSLRGVTRKLLRNAEVKPTSGVVRERLP